MFKNLELYPENFLLITNGSSTIYQTTNYQNDWDGGGTKAGKYLYILSIKGEKSIKKENSKMGSFMLYR